MTKRLGISALFMLAVAAFAWASGGPARDVSATLVGTPGPTGPPGISRALATMTETLFTSPACPAQQALRDIDDATGALVCVPVPARVTSVSASNGLTATPAGNLYTLALNGTLPGGLTVTDPSPVVTLDEGVGAAEIAFDDDSADPSYWALRANHQGGSDPSQAWFKWEFKQSNAGTLFQGFTLDGGGGFRNEWEFYGPSAASGLTMSSTSGNPTLFVQHRNPAVTAIAVHGRVDLLGPSGMTGAAVDARTFAANAAPSGAAGPSGILRAANTVRLPIYRLHENAPMSAPAAPATRHVVAVCTGGDLALGGGCETGGGTNDYISGTKLNASSFDCEFWDASPTVSNTDLVAHVICTRGY